MKRFNPCFLILSFIIIATGPALGQELSHLYQPYGFQLPMLTAGEYLISASFNRSDDESTVHYIDAFDSPAVEYDEVHEYTWQYATIAGIIGLSDQFLAEAELAVFPSTTNLSVNSYNPDGEWSMTTDNNTYLIPTVKLVYRPSLNLEFFGQFRSQNYTQTYARSTALVFGVDNTEHKSTDFSFGLTYFGKL